MLFFSVLKYIKLNGVVTLTNFDIITIIYKKLYLSVESDFINLDMTI